LNKREYVCTDCGYWDDCDIKAAQSILEEGLKILAERKNIMPAGTEANNLTEFSVKPSLVCETGSQIL
jgi:transposase